MSRHRCPPIPPLIPPLVLAGSLAAWQPPAASLTPSVSALSGLHVSVVDDELANCKMLTRLLGRLGIPGAQVFTRHNGMVLMLGASLVALCRWFWQLGAVRWLAVDGCFPLIARHL